MSTLYPSFPYQSEINNNHKEIWWRWDQNTHFQSPVFSIITLGNNLYNFNFLCFTLLYYLFIYLLQSFTWHNQNCHLQLIPLLYPQAKERKKKKNEKKLTKGYYVKRHLTYPFLCLPLSVCRRAKTSFSYHRSMQMDSKFILIHVSSITTFKFWVKRGFQYPAMDIRVLEESSDPTGERVWLSACSPRSHLPIEHCEHLSKQRTYR